MIFGLNPIVQEVLQLSKLVKIFEIYETEALALPPEPAGIASRSGELRGKWN